MNSARCSGTRHWQVNGIGSMDACAQSSLPSGLVPAFERAPDCAGTTLPEESSCRLGVSARLQVHVDDVAVLIYRPPQVVTSPSDRDENLVGEERVAEGGASARNLPRRIWARLVAPQPPDLTVLRSISGQGFLGFRGGLNLLDVIHEPVSGRLVTLCPQHLEDHSLHGATDFFRTVFVHVSVQELLCASPECGIAPSQIKVDGYDAHGGLSSLRLAEFMLQDPRCIVGRC